MKKLQQLVAPIALTLLLAASASAGIIEIGYAPPPPPPTASSTLQTNGIMETGVPSADPVVIAALGVLQSVLTLF